MLNLIVMGQIPGTNVQLSFYEIALFCFTILAVTFLYGMLMRWMIKNYGHGSPYSSVSAGSGRILSPYSRNSSSKYFSSLVKLGRLASSPMRVK